MTSIQRAPADFICSELPTEVFRAKTKRTMHRRPHATVPHQVRGIGQRLRCDELYKHLGRDLACITKGILRMYRVSSSAYDTVQSCYRPMLSCIVVTNPENVRRLQIWNVEHSLTSSCKSCAPLFARRGHYQSAMQQLRGKPDNALSSFASSVRSALETDNSRSRISRIPTTV